MFKNLLLYFLMLWLSATVSLQAQAEMSNLKESRGPSFHVDAVNLATPGHPEQSRLSLFIEVVYDELQFVKMTDSYEANYEISIIVYDKDGDQVEGKTLRENVNVVNFDQTNKRTLYNQSNQTFDLDPGTYKVDVSMQDAESNLATRIQRKIELRDYSQNKLALSDLLWLSEIVADSAGVIQSVRPQVSDVLKGLSAPAFAYFEVYNPENLESVQVDYRLVERQNKKHAKSAALNQLVGQKSMAYYFPIKIDSLGHGIYHLTVQATAGKEHIKTEKIFYIRFSTLPANAEDLDEAIEQTRYIANREEWKKMKKAKEDQRLAEFIKFWQRRDPTPGTEINEAMDAHYSRIEFANNNFHAMQQKGWRTDMGMVYVILGPPDDVERNAYPRYSKPYEIWYYYRYNEDFVFLDSTGFGDFHLETPYSIYEFQRLIDR